MRKGKVLAGVLVLLIVAGGIAAYVERCTVIAWYQTVAASVKGEKGVKSEKGAKGLYYCPMHPTFTSDRPGNCSICGMSWEKTATEAPAGSQRGQGARRSCTTATR
jgi:hypothetical protein